MTKALKEEYLMILRQRYFKATKKQKSSILDELCRNLPMHRKSATRLLNKPIKHKKANVKRLPTNLIYSNKVIFLCEAIWKENEYPCGVVLKEMIPLWLGFLKEEHHIDETTEKYLLQISASTIDRRLKNKKKQIKNRIYGTTKPGAIIRAQVPIRTTFKSVDEPGHMEFDSVSHSGPFASGEWIHTVNGVEIFCGWSVKRAVMGKGEIGVQRAIDAMREEVPFAFLDIDFDGGSEFLNWHLIRYCEKNQIGYTRSRPEQKNDQAHIEQKNRTHVRRLFGKGRLDKMAVLHAMNDLYANELSLYHNFFRPCMKLQEKKFIGSKIKRKFDKPQTPYQRLLKYKALSKETKAQLKELYQSLNPIKLKRRINQKIARIFALQYQS